MKPFYSYLITGLFAVILFLSVVQIVVSNMLSTTGPTLSKMQNQIHEYKRENTLLSEKLLFDTSLTTIASRAANLGFMEAKTQVYVRTVLPVAIKR